eukprot:Amastigsp_a508836_23.p4 type:complete len:121 gc:universal Amastigsp_a508836_23:1755-1393(-)
MWRKTASYASLSPTSSRASAKARRNRSEKNASGGLMSWVWRLRCSGTPSAAAFFALFVGASIECTRSHSFISTAAETASERSWSLVEPIELDDAEATVSAAVSSAVSNALDTSRLALRLR